jgi:hypothetical protein
MDHIPYSQTVQTNIIGKPTEYKMKKNHLAINFWRGNFLDRCLRQKDKGNQFSGQGPASRSHQVSMWQLSQGQIMAAVERSNDMSTSFLHIGALLNASHGLE